MTKPVDYFKLPFEVYYSEAVEVLMYDFKSDIECEKFEDVKAVHIQQGSSWGLSFICNENNGPELYCCIVDGHDEVAPDWLSFIEEEDINFKYALDYAVEVNGDEISFVDEDIENIDEMEYCCRDTLMEYLIGDYSPDFIILDAMNTRIKVNLEGFVLDKDNNPTNERIFDPKELNSDDFEYCYTKELWEAKSEWVKRILVDQFPDETHLRLSSITE